jgi:hypothetical protein
MGAGERGAVVVSEVVAALSRGAERTRRMGLKIADVFPEGQQAFLQGVVERGIAGSMRDEVFAMFEMTMDNAPCPVFTRALIKQEAGKVPFPDVGDHPTREALEAAAKSYMDALFVCVYRRYGRRQA